MALITIALSLALAACTFGQDCSATPVKINANGSAAISGKTDGCVRYGFTIQQGSRVQITLTSADNAARFDLQDGADDETGAEIFAALTSFDRLLTFDEFSVDIHGSPAAAFTLKVNVKKQ